MTDRELLQMALDALKHLCLHSAAIKGYDGEQVQPAIDALKARLAQPEQEPVAWADRFDIDRDGHDFWVNRQEPAKDGVPLYTAPPQREWVGLTDEEVMSLLPGAVRLPPGWVDTVRAIEAKLKEKNT
jgi:hypothetical protein